jgi:uncharacterized membrane protein
MLSPLTKHLPLLFAAVLLSGPPPLHAQMRTPTPSPWPKPEKAKYHFKIINPFDSIDTSVRGFNNWEVVVGDYATQALNAASTELGFVQVGRFAKSIKYPGATVTDTDAQDINNRGVILGMFDQGTNLGKDHAFLLDFDGFHQLPDPSDPTNPTAVYSLFADWNALNDKNEVVGVAAQNLSVGNFGPNRGFVFKNGKYTFFDAPAPATFTEANGINNQGDIVGEAGLDNATGDKAFLRRSNGTIIVFTFNNSGLETIAYGINNRGDIAGSYTTIDNGVFHDHGFIVTGFPEHPKWQTVDAINPAKPNVAQDTKIISINDDRDIAGTLSDFNPTTDTGSKGFIGEIDDE